jgi:hypothetical protein
MILSWVAGLMYGFQGLILRVLSRTDESINLRGASAPLAAARPRGVTGCTATRLPSIAHQRSGTHPYYAPRESLARGQYGVWLADMPFRRCIYAALFQSKILANPGRRRV